MSDEGAGASRIKHFVAAEKTTVAECLARHFRLDRPRIDELLALGAIYLDKRRVMADQPLEKGGYLRIHLQPKLFPVAAVNWSQVIVHEDPEFLVVNKPPGIPVHATLDNVRDNVVQQLRNRTGYELFVTQRLDTPVGGLMVLARTQAFQRRFNQWLVDRKVKKFYRAETEAAPPVGLQVHYMEPSERSPRKVEATERPGWQRCELTVQSASEYALAGPPHRAFRVELELHTGRTHQIRAQLGALGAPILGDRMYGSRFRNRGPDGVKREGIALWSVRVCWPQVGGAGWEFGLASESPGSSPS